MDTDFELLAQFQDDTERSYGQSAENQPSPVSFLAQDDQSMRAPAKTSPTSISTGKTKIHVINFFGSDNPLKIAQKKAK